MSIHTGRGAKRTRKEMGTMNASNDGEMLFVRGRQQKGGYLGRNE